MLIRTHTCQTRHSSSVCVRVCVCVALRQADTGRTQCARNMLLKKLHTHELHCTAAAATCLIPLGKTVPPARGRQLNALSFISLVAPGSQVLVPGVPFPFPPSVRNAMFRNKTPKPTHIFPLRFCRFTAVLSLSLALALSFVLFLSHAVVTVTVTKATTGAVRNPFVPGVCLFVCM